MAEDRNEEQFNQQPTDQKNAEPGQLQTPETLSGEGKFGGQSSSGDTDTDTLQPDRTTGAPTGSTGKGFIGSKSGDATTDDDSDIETGHASRAQDNDSDVEGSSGAA